MPASISGQVTSIPAFHAYVSTASNPNLLNSAFRCLYLNVQKRMKAGYSSSFRVMVPWPKERARVHGGEGSKTGPPGLWLSMMSQGCEFPEVDPSKRADWHEQHQWPREKTTKVHSLSGESFQ